MTETHDMQRVATRTGQLGLVGGIRQNTSDLVAVIEPASPMALEARKGKLFLIAEATAPSPRSVAACQQIIKVVQRTFYNDPSYSITSGLRNAIRAANKALYEQNFQLPELQRSYLGITCAVLRDSDLFVAQIQPTQAYVLDDERLRALPAHPSWDPVHVSAAPFARSDALGASLFVEPELYRCTLGSVGGAILCSSSFAHLLGRAEVEAALRNSDPTVAVERLRQVAVAHEHNDAHALVIIVAPAAALATVSPHLGQISLGEQGRLATQALSSWLTRLGGRSNSLTPRRKPKVPGATGAPRPNPLHTLPEEPGLSPDPIPRPAPLQIGASLDDHYAQLRRRSADSAPLRTENLPPSTYLGETVPTGASHRRIDLGDPAAVAPAHPYKPRYEHRPLIDLSWSERLALPFRRLAVTVEDGIRSRRNRRPITQQRPIPRGQGLSYRRTRPSFPWTLMLGLLMAIAALIFYGMTLTRQNDQQVTLEYFAAAEQRLAEVRQAGDEAAANQALALAREAIDEIRASPTVTDTNPTIWLRYQELQREYERALATVQRLTFFDSPTVLASHPLPTGRFASVVIPPNLANVTDTTVLEGLRYIYALDADTQNARLYRIPKDGGAPQAYLSPGQGVGTAVVGPLRSVLWRIDQVVAVDQAPNGFGYYFRSGDTWNYSKLGASEIWQLRDRLDVEEYGGNLYIWGAQPNEVLRFRSGSYGDTPDYWLDPAAIADLDLSTVIDMGVDGSIYLLRSNGSVIVFSQGQPVGEIIPDSLDPPLTLVKGFFVTGTGPNEGYFYLVDTLNERIIQMDKVTGQVIQQIKTRPDGEVRLSELASIFVDNAGARPILYLVNAGQIIRAELPAPPRSFLEGGAENAPAEAPTPAAAPTTALIPTTAP